MAKLPLVSWRLVVVADTTALKIRMPAAMSRLVDVVDITASRVPMPVAASRLVVVVDITVLRIRMPGVVSRLVGVVGTTRWRMLRRVVAAEITRLRILMFDATMPLKVNWFLFGGIYLYTNAVVNSPS